MLLDSKLKRKKKKKRFQAYDNKRTYHIRSIQSGARIRPAVTEQISDALYCALLDLSKQELVRSKTRAFPHLKKLPSQYLTFDLCPIVCLPASTRSLSPIHMFVFIISPINLFFELLVIFTSLALLSLHFCRARSHVTVSRAYQ